MPVIELITHINAPIAKCFDLSRSIDLHMESTKQTGETAIAGRTSGLISLGETVTWRAKHFGVWQTLISKITQFDYPVSFTDEMVSGAFKSFKHQHLFFDESGKILMKDVFQFESPLGLAGKLVNSLFLTGYMKKLLETRNLVIKKEAEK